MPTAAPRSESDREASRVPPRRRGGRIFDLAIALLAAILGIEAHGVEAHGGCRAGPPALEIDPRTLDARTLDLAVDAIVEGLLSAKDDVTFWEPARPPADESSTQAFGWTAVVLLALVESGVSPQDPRISDAVKALEARTLEGTYAVSVRTMLSSRLSARHRRMLEADSAWLLENFSGRSRGWDYVRRPHSTREDNSINQFASLALAEAAARGVEVPERLWELLERRTLEMQRPDGGWTYEGRGEPRGSMTAAGVATLFMIDRRLDPRRRSRDRVTASVDRGLAWLAARFDPARNPGHPLHEAYWLFSLERAALAGGISRLGGRDWFREGAAALVETLCEATAEGDLRMRRETPRGRTIRWHEHALGLLFLLRGRVPIALGVIEPSPGEALDVSRFAGGLVEWMGETAEREFNWLRIDPDDPVEAWLEPAILWWSPRSAARLAEDPAFAAKLQAFLDRGGLLIAALGDLDPAGRKELRTRLTELRSGAAWKDVDPSHPALSALFRIPPGRIDLESLHDGVRDLVVLDESGRFTRRLAGEARRNEDAHRTLLNLWMLAVERDRPWPRLRRWDADADAVPVAGAALEIVDLIHDARGVPEPLAASRIAAGLSTRLGRVIAASRVPIGDLLDSGPPRLLLLRGIEAPEWPDAVWQRLVATLRRGDVLVVETVGGRGDFATVVEGELVKRLDRIASPLVGDPLLAGTESSGRADLRRSTYRPSTARRTGSARAACRLRGIRLEPPSDEAPAPPAAIFTTLDLSWAVLDRPREGIDGYATESAFDLLERIASDLLAAREASATAAP